MISLGLDPSFSGFGWALHQTDAIDSSRCVAKGIFKSPSKDFFADRPEDQMRKMQEVIRLYNPDKIGVESPAFGASYSEGLYALFVAVNRGIKEMRKDVVFFAPTQVKAHARDSIRRPPKWIMAKPDMIEAAKTDTSIRKWNHNEADAYLIARLAGRFWLFLEGVIPETELTETERSQFRNVRTLSRGERAGMEVRSGLVFKEGSRFFRWSLHGDTTNGTQEEDRSPHPQDRKSPDQGSCPTPQDR